MRVDLSYHYLTHHIVPGPQSLSYFIPLILLPVALLVPRQRLSKWQNIAIFMPIILLSTIHAWWTMRGVDVISADALLWALFLLVFRDPWINFIYVSLKDNAKQGDVRGTAEETTSPTEGLSVDEQTPLDASPKVAPDELADVDEQRYPASLYPRLGWVFKLLVAIRLNNWRVGMPAHDAAQPPKPGYRTRAAFIAQTVVSFMRGYVVLDLTRAYISYDPYFHDLNVSINSPLPINALWFVPSQLVRTMVVGAQAWALISQLFYLPCLLPVTLNSLGLLADEWSPHTWDPYFGPPIGIFLHGVRGFWGRYWHQTMRYLASEPGYALAKGLGLKQNGLLRYTLISVVAFLLTGTIHMGLVPPHPLHADVETNTIRLYVAGFFWLQPVAMTFELVVSRLFTSTTSVRLKSGSRSNCSWPTALLNTVWVVTWFTLCLPLLCEAGRQLGYWRPWPVPVSIWRGLRGEGWVAWPFLSS